MQRHLHALLTLVLILCACACAQPEPDDTSLVVRADATPQTDADLKPDAIVRDSEVSMDAQSPRVDASMPFRDAEVVNDASADLGRPIPDASFDGGYSPSASTRTTQTNITESIAASITSRALVPRTVTFTIRARTHVSRA
jgi:hypothetical protein